MTNNQSTRNGIKPTRIEEKENPMLIAGLSRRCIFGEDQMDATAQWQEFGIYVDKIPGQKEYVSYGLCLDIDNGKGIEYVCGVEVFFDIDASELPGNIELKKLPSFSYAVKVRSQVFVRPAMLSFRNGSRNRDMKSRRIPISFLSDMERTLTPRKESTT